MTKTATLVTVQGDRTKVDILTPINQTIWRLEINATPEMMDTKFLAWIEECSKKLHINGVVRIEIFKQ